MPRSRDEDFKKNYAFLLYDLFDHAPVQELLHRGVIKFTTLVDLSMVIFTMHLVCLNHTPILPPPWSGSHEIYKFFFFLILKMLHTKFGKD